MNGRSRQTYENDDENASLLEYEPVPRAPSLLECKHALLLRSFSEEQKKKHELKSFRIAGRDTASGVEYVCRKVSLKPSRFMSDYRDGVNRDCCDG